MRKQNISRKTVKDRIKVWLKEHHDIDWDKEETKLKAIKDGQVVATPKFKNLDEFLDWVDNFDGEWYILFDPKPDVTTEIETNLLTKRIRK